MNKENKQWKKHLANPYFLTILVVVLSIVGILVIIFTLNGSLSLNEFIGKLADYFNGPVAVFY